MNGDIAQLVAFVCHGNSFLAGGDTPDLLRTNSTCQFCASIIFKVAAFRIASNPNEWFRKLRNKGVHGLKLGQAPRNDPHFSDRVTAGFAGGGSVWTIEATKPDGTSDYYVSTWEVGDRSSPEGRIWNVTYRKTATAKSSLTSATLLPNMTVRLTGALRESNNFALSQGGLDNWVKLFTNALAVLSGTSSDRGYHRDLFPTGSLTPEAATVLDACQSAWVFGGMGSWNDMGFDGEETQARYLGLSDYLYGTILEAITAAANDSFKLVDKLGSCQQ